VAIYAKTLLEEHAFGDESENTGNNKMLIFVIIWVCIRRQAVTICDYSTRNTKQNFSKDRTAITLTNIHGLKYKHGNN